MTEPAIRQHRRAIEKYSNGSEASPPNFYQRQIREQVHRYTRNMHRWKCSARFEFIRPPRYSISIYSTRGPCRWLPTATGIVTRLCRWEPKVTVGNFRRPCNEPCSAALKKARHSLGPSAEPVKGEMFPTQQRTTMPKRKRQRR